VSPRVCARWIGNKMCCGMASVNRRRSLLVWVLSAWLGIAGCAAPAPISGEARTASTGAMSFAVSALSRGRGVPPPTRAAWQAVWAMLEVARREGKVTRLQQTRIGLEGEVRLCAEFSDPAHARELLARARQIVEGVELINVAEESCSG
jgi:hypothetical protein